MIRKIIFPLLLLIIFSVNAIGQIQKPNISEFTSRKGLYKISYNNQDWEQSTEESGWDAVFQGSYGSIDAYFMEYDYFISEKNIKSTIKEEFQDSGKIKNFKMYKKKINNLDVNYYEMELIYSGLTYLYQGFFYNGKGGSIQLQFGFQKECGAQCQKLVDEFNSGLKLAK